MNMKEFQGKLGALVELAKKNGNKISREGVEQYFRQDAIDSDQLDKICEYLVSQKIQVSGALEVQREKNIQWKEEPLSAQEQDYVRNYKATLPSAVLTEEQFCDTVRKSVSGDESARQLIIENLLPEVVEIACRLHEKHVPLADTIAEGNMHLIMVVHRLDCEEGARETILRGVEEGIRYMIEEQLQQHKQDKTMVDKVARLEAAIKDLTEGDDKLEFSVDELSIFLDMSREEIEDILRLAGEDK